MVAELLVSDLASPLPLDLPGFPPFFFLVQLAGMAVTEVVFRQAMADVNNQMQMLERFLNARIALAESEVLWLRSCGEDGAKSGKSGHP